MSAGDDETLDILRDPALAADLADTARAVILARGARAARQRLGAARARLRMAELNAEDAAEIAIATAEVAELEGKASAARRDFEEADIRKPQADDDVATLFGQTSDRPQDAGETRPLTAALLSEEGRVLDSTAVEETGAFTLRTPGTVTARLQISDSRRAILFRDAEPRELRAGTIEFRDVTLGAAKPQPAPPPTTLTMPDLSNQSEAAACAMLARIGITDVKIVDAPNSSTPGLVVGQDPAAGTDLRDGQPVSLTIGRAGTGGGTVRLPSFIGELAPVAQERAANLGVRTELEIDERADAAPNTVVAQSEERGTPVSSIDILVLTITPPRTIGRVQVPGVEGLPRNEAAQTLRRAGLRDSTSDRRVPGARDVVMEQAPGKDEIVLAGSTVRLFLGRGLDDPDRPVTDPGGQDDRPQDPDVPQRPDPGGPERPDPGAFRRTLSKAMRADERFERLEVTASVLTRILGQLEISDRESAEAVLAMEPADIRDATSLTTLKAVRLFATLLRAALPGIE